MKIYLIAGLLTVLFSANAQAAKIDAYRDLLLKNSYTIRYENITPPPRVTNADRVELYGKSGLAVEGSNYLLNKPKRGVITCAGTEKYEEVGEGDFYMCRLSKNAEDFFYTKYRRGGDWEYFGTRKNRVEANAKNYLARLIEGESYGDADMSRLLNAILPDEVKSAQQAGSRFIAAGTLDDGNTYEDYRTDRDGVTEIVRCYFNGNALIKIASASYHRKADGKIDGRKCIIKIKEFSATPDRSLLRLPAKLQDVTERRKG